MAPQKAPGQKTQEGGRTICQLSNFISRSTFLDLGPLYQIPQEDKSERQRVTKLVAIGKKITSCIHSIKKKNTENDE